MIDALYFFNVKGDIIIHRVYNNLIKKAALDQFRTQIISRKEASSVPPIFYVDKYSFMYTRKGDMYLIAISESNCNPSLVFQFLFQFRDILTNYLGTKWNENSLKNKYTLVYELLDETLDSGYPQNCSIEALRLYINLGSANVQETAGSQLTEAITGKTDWRRQDLKYKKNEVFIDVLESVNLLLSADGTILSQAVSGKIMMKAFLTGMPECKFGLNDKIIIDKEIQSGQRPAHRAQGVEIDDCTFHRCVRLGKFDIDRTITFIPPDGEFELMRYRIVDSVNLPFRVIPVIEERGKTRVAYNLKVVANYSPKLYANNVVFKIPCPSNTARAKLYVNGGKAKYEPGQKAIVWRIRRFTGAIELNLTGEAELMSTTQEKTWSKPPIQVEFHIPMFTSSGLSVRYLKVIERSGYKTTKWVRYMTINGGYQIRV